MIDSTDIIIDTDPGIDDAMCILLALSLPHINILGLTIVHGNLGGEKGLKQLGLNAIKLLRLAGRLDIPVYLGEATPNNRPAHGGAPFVHGEDGCGDCLPPSEPEDSELLKTNAAQWMVSTIMSRPPQSVTIVALGPLSNLGKVLEMEPQVGSRTRHLYTMGGTFFRPGNISPNAEANIYNDPDAANLVLSEFHAVTISPLDVTCQTTYGKEFTEAIQATCGNPHIGKFIYDCHVQYLRFYKEYNGLDCCFCHDSTALGTLVWPDLFSEQKSSWIRVETNSELTLGATVGDFRGTKQNVKQERPKNVTIHFKVNAEEFKRQMLQTFQKIKSSH